MGYQFFARVDVIGKYTPKIVKTDGAKHRSWTEKNEVNVLGE